MPEGRDKSKKMLGFWATPEEKAALQKAAKKAGYTDLGAFLRAIAEGAVKVSPHIKALALSAMGVQQSGCGGPLIGLILLAGLVLYAVS